MKVTQDQTTLASLHGIDLKVYPLNRDEIDLCRVSVKEGHFQEFFHKTSTFVYYILEGTGTFYLDGAATPVKVADVIVAPPGTKIYYFGQMEMILVTIRPYQPSDYSQVQSILKETGLFDEIWDSAENLEGLSQQQPSSLFVGEMHGEIVAQIYTIRFGSRVAQLYRLAVKQAFQKQGIATQLLQQVEQTLKSQGVVELGLFVDAQKTSLLDFYVKRGYGGNQSHWIYQWKRL